MSSASLRLIRNVGGDAAAHSTRLEPQEWEARLTGRVRSRNAWCAARGTFAGAGPQWLPSILGSVYPVATHTAHASVAVPYSLNMPIGE